MILDGAVAASDSTYAGPGNSGRVVRFSTLAPPRARRADARRSARSPRPLCIRVGVSGLPHHRCGHAPDPTLKCLHYFGWTQAAGMHATSILHVKCRVVYTEVLFQLLARIVQHVVVYCRTRPHEMPRARRNFHDVGCWATEFGMRDRTNNLSSQF